MRLGKRTRRSLYAVDRKIARFQRLVEQHEAVLDLFADMRDKQSGEYILDRQYIEARLDRAYEGVRRILYDMHVICGSGTGEGYEEVDRLRTASERILKDVCALAGKGPDQTTAGEGADWETLALQALYRDLTRMRGEGFSPDASEKTPSASPGSLAEWAEWAHAMATRWITDNLSGISATSCPTLCDCGKRMLRLRICPLGGSRDQEDIVGNCLAQIRRVPAGKGIAFPLGCFLEGWIRSCADSEEAEIRLLDRGEEKQEGGTATCIRLYTGEGVLLLLFPSSFGLDLFWCSLSVGNRRNHFYLHASQPLGAAVNQEPQTEDASRESLQTHGFRGLPGGWIGWVSGFSWGQGEERIRLLGSLLRESLLLCAEGATQERVGEHMREGLHAFFAGN